jgi:hypothetical protein
MFSFLNNYSTHARGPHKLKLLIQFLVETKPEFIKNFLKTVENENQIKLNDLIESLKETEQRKKLAEDRNRELKEQQKTHETKVNDRFLI